MQEMSAEKRQDYLAALNVEREAHERRGDNDLAAGVTAEINRVEGEANPRKQSRPRGAGRRVERRS